MGCTGVYITQTCYHDVELTVQEQCKWSVLGCTSHRGVYLKIFDDNSKIIFVKSS